MNIETFHRTHIEGQSRDALSLALRKVCSYRHDAEAPPAPTLIWDAWNSAGHDTRSLALGWDVWSAQQPAQASSR